MKKSSRKFKSVCMLLISGLLVTSYPSTDAMAATNQKLYNYVTKSTMMVDDTKITYVYNGKNIELAGTPGILTNNGVALAPYIPIFNKALRIKTKYESDKKKVTFTKGNTELVLTLGSKIALLNGEPISMNAAPISAKYSASGAIAVLVPTRFVAETFGYNYEWNSSKTTVTITSKMNLFYDNQSVVYSGAQGKVSLDGKNIKVTNMPTLLIGNTAMVQSYRVFSNTLGVRYRYYKTTGILTFKKGDITLQMELGSSIVKLNGQIADCGTSPKLIKNLDTGVETVMVPAQFVSRALGYNYSWNGTTKTSEIITSPLVGVTPNLILSSASSTPGKEEEYFEWTVDAALSDSVNKAQTALLSNKNLVLNEGSNSYLTGINDSEDDSESESLNIQLSNKLDSVSSSVEDNKVTISLKNTESNSMNALWSNELINDVSVTYDSVNLETNIVVTTNDTNPSFALIPSEDHTVLTVKFYPNYITEVRAGRDSNGYQYISLTGLAKLAPVITEDDSNFYLNFSKTVNGISDRVYSSGLMEDDKIHSVILGASSNDSSLMIIAKPSAESSYGIHEDGNTLTLYIDREEKIPVINDTPIQIPLADGVTASSITDEDKYYNKQFVIRIPGDHRDFYQMNPIINSYSNVANIKVSYDYSNYTIITVTTNKIQGYSYQVEDGILVLTVDNPSKIYDKIVILDAGHGGKDPGAVNGSTREKVINFNVLNVYAKDYFSNSGIKVYYTRVDDTLIALQDRANFATEVEADLFISLHCNAATNTAARGTSVYYSSTNKAKTESGLTSKLLAGSLVSALSSTLGTKNLGTIDKGFVVVRDNSVPAVLIELAFLTNPGDKANLTSAGFQKKAAQTIFNTVVDIFKAYPTKR